jgi:Fibronectin type III domain/Putative Ig domain
MRTPLLTSGKTGGGLLAATVLALSFATVTHASTTISGTPATSVAATRYYAFQSWATDTDHATVTYSIANKPSWATFDTKYGHLYGVPTAANVGTYSNIVISASDGVSKASLPAFSIQVTGTGSSSGSGSTGGSTTTGAATVNWHPPTQNSNGSTITNLAGYTIEYGTNKSNLTSSVKLANPGLTSYVIENLAAGTYYFGVTAYNSAGGTSAVSGIVSKTIK